MSRGAKALAARRAYYAINKDRENKRRRYRYKNEPGKRERELAQNQEWRNRNPGWWRERRGLPEPARPKPIKCECCGKPPCGRFGLCLDHSHKTGEFRGWICSPCNRAIGQLGDGLRGVMNAVYYLEGVI